MSRFATTSLSIRTVRLEIGMCSDFVRSLQTVHSTCYLLSGALSCRKSHDIPLYLSTKPADLVFPDLSFFDTSTPFLVIPDNAKVYCPTFNELGFCPQGFKCRFLSAHITAPLPKPTSASAGEAHLVGGDGLEEKFAGKLVIDEEKKERIIKEEGGKWREKNWIRNDLQSQLRSNNVSRFRPSFRSLFVLTRALFEVPFPYL